MYIFVLSLQPVQEVCSDITVKANVIVTTELFVVKALASALRDVPPDGRERIVNKVSSRNNQVH